MDVSGVFNKLRNTLSSTVSEITAALPGNPLLREYDAGDQVGSAGPKFMWKIYHGTKKSTKAEVAIWVLEKKQLDQLSRNDKETVLETFRRGCVQMTKLRHPRVLTVEHSLEESRESLAFCTEPVFASLGNVLGKKTNINSPPKELLSYELHEVEIKYGMMQLSEALAFLHGSVKMIHGNVCPESIIINKVGAWKIAGFDFCVSNSGSISDVKFECKDWDTSLPAASLPNPNYLAPEYILRKSCDTSSDLFSLGVLLYAVYCNGRTLFYCDTQDVYRSMPKNADKLENLNAGLLEKIPPEVREHEKMLLNPDPNVRPDADQMAKLPFFGHVGVMTLQYLDTLLQRDNLQKSQFFKGLPKVLPQLPKRVVMKRVLPCLTSEFNNHDMIPFVLPNVLTIAEDCSVEQFTRFVFPSLVPVFKVQKPIQVLLILLQKMELLLSKTPPDKIQGHILPMLASALGSPSLQIQELCMSIIPEFAEKLDLQAMKSSILPKIRKIALEGETISISIHAIVCIGKLVSGFDKWFIQDEILPFLQKTRSREPGILMAILGVYQTVLRSDKLGISKDVMAAKSLPFLIPLSVESTLNLKQYSAFMVVIKEMMKRVENEHRSKLEQLSKMQLEQDSALDFTKQDLAQQTPQTTTNKVDDIFGSKPNEMETTAAKQHLTLEEKQRLAKMKEQEYRMKKAGEIKPISVATPVTKTPRNPAMNKPKDLTSSLMQNNLNAMSAPSMSRPFGAQPAMMTSQTPGFMQSQVMPPQTTGFNAQKPMTSHTGTMMSQMGSMRPQGPMQWGSTAPSNGVNPSPFGMQKSTSFPAMNGSSVPSKNSPSMTSRMGSMTLQPQQMNVGSFDNLLSMPSHQKTKSMNEMKGMAAMQPTSNAQSASFMSQNPFLKPQPTAMAAPAVSSNSQLSKQDLLDFLG